MDRRSFFKAMAGTAVGVTAALVLPELDLLKPSRTYFLPPTGGWKWREVHQWAMNNDPLPMRGDIVTFSDRDGLWLIGDRTTELWTFDADFLSGDQWTPTQQQQMLARAGL